APPAASRHSFPRLRRGNGGHHIHKARADARPISLCRRIAPKQLIHCCKFTIRKGGAWPAAEPSGGPVAGPEPGGETPQSAAGRATDPGREPAVAVGRAAVKFLAVSFCTAEPGTAMRRLWRTACRQAV